MKVWEFMTVQVVSAKPTDTVKDEARMMSEIDSGAIPVIEDDLVSGMITDRDIIIRVIAERKDGFTPVSEVMTQGVESCLETTSLRLPGAWPSYRCAGSSCSILRDSFPESSRSATYR